jgi:GDP-L-fucose synthase
MKVLVLGSTGLVGSSLIRTFSNKKLFNIFSPNRSELDLFSLIDVQTYIQNLQPDYIINAAAKVGGILANNTYRADFILENLKININILESVIPFNSIKVINLGSSCIYPLNAPNPIKEEYFMTGELEATNSPYAMAKISAIELGRSLNTQYGHNVVNLMPTNLYGPNDNFSDKDSHVIPGLMSRMHNAKKNNLEKFEVWGTGKPLREFLYVDDLAEAILFIIQNQITEDLVNIGSNEEVSIQKLVDNLVSTIGYDGEILFNSKYPDGNPRKLLDSSKIKTFGWNPKTNLKEGLGLTYNWYKKNLQI